MTTIMNSALGSASKRRRRAIVALLVVEALSLAVISVLHLSGVIRGGTRPYNPEAAGIAEAVIGVVLIVGAVAVVSSPKHGRAAAQAATGFAIAGFIVGLTFTLIGGQPVDVAYHVTVLPLLILTLVLSVPKPKDLGVGRGRGPGATPR
jgi:peptidoglycan/LPS O-acetylase OafA/YrhL